MSEKFVSERKSSLDNLTAALEKVVSVNSFFISAAYGTYFGIWAIFREHIASEYVLWSGLLLIVSATIFAGWHMIGNLTFASVATSLARTSSPHTAGFAERFRVRTTLASMVLIKKYYFPVSIAAAMSALLAMLTLIVGGVRTLGT